MRILLFIDSLGSGGAQRQMLILANVLKQKGYDVSFLLYHEKGFFQNEVDQLKIPIHIVSTKIYLKRMLQTRKYIRNGNFSAVISFLDTPNFLNNFASIGGKSWKVITSERSSKESFLFTLQGKVFGWFQRFSDAIVCNSYQSMLIWEKYYPEYKNKLFVIYNQVNFPVISEEYIPKREGKIHLIIVASYQKLKNPLGLIEALKLLSNDEKEKLSVKWFGEKKVSKIGTAVYDEAKLKIIEYHLTNTITLNESTKDIANEMFKADVVALFSELEGLPNAICEGMMLGKPIIMSRVSDYYLLITNTNGFLCDWDKPDTIKKALLDMMQLSDDELLTMGHCSRQIAKKIFSSEMLINKWLNLIDN